MASDAPTVPGVCACASTRRVASRSSCRGAAPPAPRRPRSKSCAPGSSAACAAARAAIAARGCTLPYLGTPLELRPEPGRARVHRRGDALLVPADPERAAAAIERWYRRAAAKEIAPRLEAAAAALGTSYTTLSIRGQRTRWGSCSSTGAMSFNWRLLLAPAPVLDYVVWHEACHLRVMDHSPRFWALVRSHCPDYEEQRRWLRRYGATLVL
ncbi:MAG: M48 family metallopeptidase [Actinobacteria bacterium]|nr:M48 family metallopeptidase [Actinomycetota bacterium]